jgi:putative endonuclease
MFQVYILQSIKNGKYYIGHTHNVASRLLRHNSGQVRSTKHGTPWEIVYTEKYQTRSEAYKREFEIKSYKGGILFKKLLGLWKN